MTDLFTLAAYRELLQSLDSGKWTFSSFENSTGLLPNQIVLRHDIDAELYLLDSFLDIEESLETHATYFLMLESPFYNLSSPEGRRIVKRISEAGHSIGLHFFGEIHAGLPRPLLELEIRKQVEFLADFVAEDISAFSFHQPTREMLEMDLDIPGLVNTYHSRMMTDFTYISDTNMSWKPSAPPTVIQSGATRIQLLVHPLWWMIEGATPVDRWRQVVSSISHIHAQHLLTRERTLAWLSLDQLMS
jgi:hypothetical protein